MVSLSNSVLMRTIRLFYFCTHPNFCLSREVQLLMDYFHHYLKRITGALVLHSYFDPYTFKIGTAHPHTPMVKDADLISFLGLSYLIQKTVTKLSKSMIDTFSFLWRGFHPWIKDILYYPTLKKRFLSSWVQHLSKNFLNWMQLWKAQFCRKLAITRNVKIFALDKSLPTLATVAEMLISGTIFTLPLDRGGPRFCTTCRNSSLCPEKNSCQSHSEIADANQPVSVRGGVGAY